MYKAWVNNVVLLYLPNYSTHLLQPLDVSVFASLKSHYHDETSDRASYDIKAPVAKSPSHDLELACFLKLLKRLRSSVKGVQTTRLEHPNPCSSAIEPSLLPLPATCKTRPEKINPVFKGLIILEHVTNTAISGCPGTAKLSPKSG